MTELASAQAKHAATVDGSAADQLWPMSICGVSSTSPAGPVAVMLAPIDILFANRHK